MSDIEIARAATAQPICDIADKIGMDRAMTERLFQSDADVDDIETRDRHGRERGVTGVPTFVVASQHVVVGAQPTELWLNVIDELSGQVAEPEE